MAQAGQPGPGRGERTLVMALLCALVAFSLWGVAGGWRSRALPGNGFRQTQTAITALFVQREHNFSLAYPTPVLGKPWSVPFEFPLYQWTVAVVSDTTGLSLIKCGRLVSAVCFFLGLPAVWLLLRRLGTSRTGRAAVLGMVLTCPLLLFYARAFLIETMALMFALWFLQAFVAAVERRRLGWLVMANLAGAGAGLVKVTTFMVYLVPAAVWALWWLWREWRANAGPARWRELTRLGGWIAGATAAPFATTYAWLLFSDHTKMLNPSARSLVSSTMHGYNFGNWSYRSDPAIWAAHWRTISTEILPVGTLALVLAVAVLTCRGRRLAWVAASAGLFLLAPVVFPVLYAWHEYYFTAVAVLPMIAAGLVLAGLLDGPTPRGRAWAVVALAIGLQMQTYLRVHRPQQLEDPHGSSDLCEALRYTTERDDVLVIAGEDWSSVTPFYAQRRALMLRRGMERDWPYIHEAFDKLAGERVAALVLRGAQRDNTQLIETAALVFGLDRNPVWRVRDVQVFVPTDRVPAVLARLAQLGIDEVELCRTDVASDTGEIVWEEPYLSDKQRRTLAPLNLPPVRFTARFGLAPAGLDGRSGIGAHAPAHIWCRAPAGRHELVFEFAIAPGAYEGLRRTDATDGVEFVVAAARGRTSRRVLFSRLLRPFDEPADRGWQQERITLALEDGEELLFETLPGPADSPNRDWAMLGRCELR
ncbi:MAG: glycosyltransferase family 39 protein [Opitutaceae bacterium]